MSSSDNAALLDENTILQMVTFLIDREEFGIDIMFSREIIPVQRITRVPHSLPHVLGVINLRGRIIPVVDLRLLLKKKRREDRSDNTRIIICDFGEKIVVGLMVDAVREIVRFPQQLIEPPPEVIAGIDRHYVHGVTKIGTRLIVYLDVVRLLLLEEAEEEEQEELDDFE